jgi:hypothetical protein
VYCAIAASLSAPVACRLRARSAFAAASASVASASTTGGLRLRELDLDRLRRERREDLAAPHDVADVDLDVGEAQAVRLGADAGLLPGRDVAVGGDPQRQGSRAAAA